MPTDQENRTTPVAALRTTTRTTRLVAPVLLIAAVAVYGFGVRRVDPTTLDAFGLVSRLHPLVWIGLGLMICAAVVELAGEVRSRVLTLACAAAVVMIYGLQALTYGAARLPIGWLHVGFANQIIEHGVVVHFFDTRFSWPGFFTTAAFWSQAAGFDSAEPLIKWAPVVLFGLAAVCAHALFVAFLGRGRAAWIATLLFIGGDWTEQEYFSPQGLAYILALGALAITAQVLAPSLQERRPRSLPWRRSQPTNAPGARIAAQLAVVAVAAALAPSHQLTPFILAGCLIVFWLFGRLSPGWLPWVALLLPCAWFVLGAQEFWIGQLSLLTTGAGDLSSSIDQGIAGRVAGSLGHETMVLGRIGLTALMGGCFVVSLWFGRRRIATPWLLAALVAVSFGMAVVQPYGGEIFMRCYLFALPWFAIGTAAFLALCWERRRGLGAILTAVLVLAVSFGTVAVRGGNDAYVAFGTADVEAMKVADAAARPGDSVIAPLWYAPLRLDRVGDVIQLSTEELATADEPCRTEAEMVGCLVDRKVTFVVLTPAQQQAGEILDGFGPGWLDQLREQLQAAGYTTIYDRDGRVVLAAPR